MPPASSESLGTQNLSFPDQKSTGFQSCSQHFPATWPWVSFNLSGCLFPLLSETDAEPIAQLCWEDPVTETAQSAFRLCPAVDRGSIPVSCCFYYERPCAAWTEREKGESGNNQRSHPGKGVQWAPHRWDGGGLRTNFPPGAWGG